MALDRNYPSPALCLDSPTPSQSSTYNFQAARNPSMQLQILLGVPDTLSEQFGSITNISGSSPSPLPAQQPDRGGLQLRGASGNQQLAEITPAKSTASFFLQICGTGTIPEMWRPRIPSSGYLPVFVWALFWRKSALLHHFPSPGARKELKPGWNMPMEMWGVLKSAELVDFWGISEHLWEGGGRRNKQRPGFEKWEKEAPGVIPQPAQLHFLERSWDKWWNNQQKHLEDNKITGEKPAWISQEQITSNQANFLPCQRWTGEMEMWDILAVKIPALRVANQGHGSKRGTQSAVISVPQQEKVQPPIQVGPELLLLLVPINEWFVW